METSAQVIRAVRSLRTEPNVDIEYDNDIEALIKISEILCVKNDNESKISSVAKGLLAEAVAELHAVVKNRDSEREMYISSWFGSFDEKSHERVIRRCCERVESRIRIVEKYIGQDNHG